MENGVIQAYHATQASEAYKTMPAFPRTNEVIRSVQLLNKTVITLDSSKRELTSWTYQHSSSVESTRFYLDDIIINEYAIASSAINLEIVYVLVLTNNHWIEIYPSKSLKHEPLFSLHLRCSVKVHSTPNGNFFILTNKGSIYFIKQKITGDKEITFEQTAQAQLNISCSMMLSSVLILNELECFIVFADNAQSMTIWTTEKIINTLIASQVDLNKSNDNGSVQLTPFDEVDKFCLRQDCLAAYNNGKTHLNLHNVRSYTCYEPIQLENECIQLCLNQSATYVFALAKPRILFMYRINDCKQLAKLFVYDFVSFMTADNEFLVLTLNDRRLLTLMIADPDDPTVQTRIQSLPSRTHSTVNDEEELGSDKEEDVDEVTKNSTNKKNVKTKAEHLVSPISLYRCVTRFNGRHSLAKMSNDYEILKKVGSIWSGNSDSIDITQLVNDSDQEDHDDDNDVQTTDQINRVEDQQQSMEVALNDIRQKRLEYDRQQIKGVQFSNVGDGNLKVVNNSSVTSSTCILT
ncbi:unnamed protein product [Rotaria magnacalcarata]|uniref:Uncharacterized protein n=1 Tax=Rotaria magnacalcarata TaxID=392030 RepID=A0A819N771_9BILA|nr:unnamed protein product [Rotaria magnacalcarata]